MGGGEEDEMDLVMSRVWVERWRVAVSQAGS